MRAEQQSKVKSLNMMDKCRNLNLKKSDNTVLRLKTPLDGEVVVKIMLGEI